MPPVLGVILAGGLSRRMGGGDKPLLRLGGRTLLDRVAERFAPQCGAGLILNANGDPDRFGGFDGAIVPDGVPGNPGPLAGILAALDHAATHHPEVDHVASVSGDAPFLPHDLVRRLDDALFGSMPDASGTSLEVGSSVAGPLSWKERDRVRCVTSPDNLHTPPQPSPSRRGSPSSMADAVRSHGMIAVASSGGRQHFTTALWSLALRDDLRAALVERDERRVGAYLARHGAVAVDWPATPVDPFLNVNTPEDLAAAEALLGGEGA